MLLACFAEVCTAIRHLPMKAISYFESSSLTEHAGLTRRAVSRPLVKGNGDAGNEGAMKVEILAGSLVASIAHA